ncbi:CMGC family protein kinase [Trichomonas vaginalis G3]|uniref:CMGC family protein kinase n=1 Tax=Trichomonas vaginalis (strain ATCC PRA-98 / G3) TaxID=412133 RepID=A2DB18_TRIV3|nr:protein kinase protein [Trichomonas vaginalis G3]EAY22348.1 CMGC family protein kinase [Trichomonas vaginalis G3]KAI5518286.1 protein kinase protein [Trichomonas vaginalis G3]|eukprot:XP_001583334.1 CMGC family protein kinase [Trichomonas vaginalis G3]
MSILEQVTINVQDTFHEINPSIFKPPSFELGRPLNTTEEIFGEDTLIDGHKVVHVHELIEDNNGNVFRVIDTLGNGTFSYVYKCQLLGDIHSFFAMKIIKNLPQYHATGISEVSLHQLLSSAPDHPGKSHIIMPISSFEMDNHVIIVEPLLFRSLFEGIYQNRPVSQLLSTIRNIMEQILQGVSFLHANGVTHCDLKPDNVLFDDENMNNLQIIDLGSASMSPTGAGDYIQSRFYRSPEVILGLPYTNKIDLWSAGCIASELFLNFAIFATNTEFDTIHSMVALLGPFPDSMIQPSKQWWKFFDMTRDGYKLKMDPNDVLLERHLYNSIFQETGPSSLENLIMNHCDLETDDDVNLVSCFSHFCQSLLQFDPNTRLSAEQALSHPFITEDIFSGEWYPECEEDIPHVAPVQTLVRSSSMDRIATSDFLNMF